MAMALSPKRAIIMAVCATVTAPLIHAAEISMTGNDPGGSSSFNSAGKWSNGQMPTSGNTYATAYLLRTPESESSFTFAGDRLTLSPGGNFGIKSSGVLTVANFVLNGGAVSFGIQRTTPAFAGGLTVAAPSPIVITDPGQRWLNIQSPLSGTADLTLYVSDAEKRVFLTGGNTAFTGRLNVRGKGRLFIGSEENLGGNPAAYQTDQLTFGGAALTATNTFTLDDANRGIRLDNTAATSSVVTAAGNLPAYTYPGGVFEISAATVTVACAISGDGPLTKTGGGALILAGTNTYTGLTTVQGGTLRLLPGAAHAASSILATGETSVVSGEGVLSNLTLAAGAALNTGGVGWDIGNLAISNADRTARISMTLSDSATNSPMIRISGSLNKPAFQRIVLDIDQAGMPQAPCLLLSAPNLDDYGTGDFSLYPPWIGTLSITSGTGGEIQTLVLTPHDPAKVIHQTTDDPGNTSAFTRGAAWSDNQPPSADKMYVNTGRVLRTPASGSATFAGRTLFAGNGCIFALKGTGVPTVSDLVLFDNASVSASEGNVAGNSLDGTAHVHPGGNGQYAATVLIPPDGMGRTVRIFSTLTGSGDLLLQYSGTALSPSSVFTFYRESPGFSGRIHMAANTNVWLLVSSEEKLGSPPPVFRADQLAFNGGGLTVTNDVTLDDPGRGITLTGSLATNTCTLRPGENATLTVACPITGPGALMKKGKGTLVLAGENSYTGPTTVLEGIVCPASPRAFGNGSVYFAAGSTLQRRCADTALTNGVEFAAGVTFETGSTLQLLLDGETASRHIVVIPLFLLPPGETINLDSLSVSYAAPNYRLQLFSETIGSGDSARERVSAKLTLSGTLVSVR